MKRPWCVWVSTAALSVLLMASPSAWPQGDAIASAWNQHQERGTWSEGRHEVVFPYARALPDSRLTPGALNPAVTPATLRETICRRGGYTRSVRPAERYTEALKRAQIREYGYSDRRLGDYEEDHLISLELGGSPDSPRNLWPEPHHVVGGWGSYAKDRLENRLHWMVCHGQISLSRAQYLISHDWIGAYRKYLGSAPHPRRRHHHRAYW